MSFDANNLHDGIVAVFLTNTNSQIYKNEFPRYSDKKSDLNSTGVDCVFAVDESFDGFVNSVDILASQKKSGESLVFLLKSGDTFSYLTHKETPEAEGDWTGAIKQFALNYANNEADDKNLWCWGQIVQEDGDYLCVDCGYIGEFKKGEIFPICEVCLSGDPAGPSGPEAGYWEKV